LVFIAQILAYFQLQGQFIFPWAKKNLIFMVLLGLPISYIYWSSNEAVIRFENLVAVGFICKIDRHPANLRILPTA
jgi:hypothetical protein